MIQKAIYLAQLSGVDLGYRFGWYLKGPYSQDLTRDYFRLSEANALETSNEQGANLREDVENRLLQVKPLLNIPDDVALPQEDWLELVASLHYLRKVQGKSPEVAREALEAAKPQLAMYSRVAEQSLEEMKLLPLAR
ncbi:MAG: hypothetical protein M3464_01560 [Chloroflexota bacterium]|nr:hypothetical protein [Chloroflexota bacterium]